MKFLIGICLVVVVAAVVVALPRIQRMIESRAQQARVIDLLNMSDEELNRPAPPGWDLTNKDLTAEMAAGKRESIGPPETTWAYDYELSLLPEGTRFPRRGDVYEAIREIEQEYLTSWRAPYTGGDTCILQPGDRLYVPHDPQDDRPLAVGLSPVDYGDLERRIVPAHIRDQDKYAGFYFVLKTRQLNIDFKLVESDYVPDASP